MRGRFGKVVLVVLGVLLMLVFILPSGLGGGGGGGRNPVVGTLGDRDVRGDEVRAAGSLLAYAANNVRVQAGQTGQMAPLPTALLGPELADTLLRDPELFYLLLSEARQNGLRVPSEEVTITLENQAAQVIVPDKASPDGRRAAEFATIPGEQVRANVIDATAAVMDVARSAGRFVDFYKVSEPVVDYHLALSNQRVDLRTVVFEAGEFLEGVPEPTDAQVREQFDKFKDTAAGSTVTEDNPFALGYRLPARVKLGYVALPPDAAADKVRRDLAARPLADRELELYRYWSDNRALFPAPATRPATRPAADGDTLTADAGEVRTFLDEQSAKVAGTPSEADWLAYVAVHDRVLDRLVSTRASELETRVLRRLRDELSTDYRTSSAARDDATNRPATSADYLPNLAKKIADDFGVRPDVRVLDRDMLDAEALSDPAVVGPIAEAILPQVGAGFPAYVLAATGPLLTPEQREQIERGGALLELYQPSQTLIGIDGASYVFRVTDAAAESPPRELSEVESQVREDLRQIAAYDQALAAAESLAAQARESSLTAAAESAGRTVLDPPAFVPAAGPGPADAAAFGGEPGQPLDFAARLALQNEAYKLLGREASDGPRLGVLALRPALAATVAEVQDVTATWDDLALRREQVRSQLSQRTVGPGVVDEFFDRDSVLARTGFVPRTQGE